MDAAELNQRIAESRSLTLDLSGEDIEALPDGLSIRFSLELSNCKRLRRLPEGLQAGSLILDGCTALESLPENLSVSFLDISNCPQLDRWPAAGRLEAGRLRAQNCTGLRDLPPWIGRISQLDLRGCENIQRLPDTLRVTSWIDLADTQITRLPPSLARAPLRWKGVPIDERIAFRPEEITSQEVLAEANTELRRVKLERMGFDQFLEEAQAEVLDEDADPGGPRRLLRVELEDDEPLVCVAVICPSTDRQYVLRVPPEMKTCHQAVAWTAGFDNPDDYRPLVEK